MQEKCNSSALAMELRLSCINPSILEPYYTVYDIADIFGTNQGLFAAELAIIGFGDNTDLLWCNNVNNQFCQLTTRVSYQRGIRRPFKCTGKHTYWGLKNNRGVQSKNVFKICEGIPCSSFSVKELDIIVHKRYFPCITMLNFGHSVPHITSEPGGWGGN